jgi:hypothetical protein
MEKLQAETEPAPDLRRECLDAKAAWLRAMEEQNEVLLEVPSQIPGTDGSLPIEKAGTKRKAAYLKYRESLKKYRDLLKQTGAAPEPGPEFSTPES